MKKLIAFDLDGTLTQHKSVITDQNLAVLRNISNNYKTVIVGAGSCERISKQLFDIDIDIIGQYGLESARLVYANEQSKLEYYEKTLLEIDKAYFKNKIGKLRKSLGFLDYKGESVEFHSSGIVTFPLLGTDAVLENKLAFDPDRKTRRAMYQQVLNEFGEYNVFIGGSSSYDITPKEVNKYIALTNYCSQLKIKFDDILYFGDDFGIGGNDEHIYLSDIDFVEVMNFEHFPILASRYLNIN